MRKLGLIQPGRIGDIIICLPIAKWYADHGYEVVWPIWDNIADNFTEHVDYVTFIKIPFDCNSAHEMCKRSGCNVILDLAFNIPNASAYNTQNYASQNLYSFDEYKYFIANVPFEEKWNLSIKRNKQKEDLVKEYLKLSDPFVIVQENSSDFTRRVDWANGSVRRVDITGTLFGVFDWIGVLEDAQQHILIESCFTNLIDQLNIRTDKHVLLMKNGYYGTPLQDGRPRGLPVLKLDWNKL